MGERLRPYEAWIGTKPTSGVAKLGYERVLAILAGPGLPALAALFAEDAVVALPDDVEPPDKWSFPLTFNWGVPPLPNGPDLLRLAIDLAGIGGIDLPLEISATDSFGSVTDPPVRRLSIVAKRGISLAHVLAGEELLCETFDRALSVSRFLLERAPAWLGQ